MVSKALVSFQSTLEVVDGLWQERTVALTAYHRARRDVRTATDPFATTVADARAQNRWTLHRALVQSAQVRLVTAWEVFLADLVAEHLKKNPQVFRTTWKFAGTRGADYRMLVATIHNRPFQSPGKAKEVLQKYLGKDILGQPAQTGVNFAPVEDAVALRNAIVHRGGAATDEMRKRLGVKRQAADSYLLAPPSGSASVPATNFERIQMGVLEAALTLDRRAAMPTPRPP
jgi:hypothetical protein